MKAFEVIDSPEKWCQGAYARVKTGRDTFPENRYAICWCATGAINISYPKDYPNKIGTVEKKIGMALAIWNDAPERTHAEVYGLLKRLDI